jgi:hypothetical protein
LSVAVEWEERDAAVASTQHQVSRNVMRTTRNVLILPVYP